MAYHSDKFNKRFDKLEIPEQNDFTIKKADYAKDKVTLCFISDGSGWKTSIHLHADIELNLTHNQYSHRAKGYQLSIAKTEKFLKLYKDR